MPVNKLLDVLADHAAEVDEIAEDTALGAAFKDRMMRLLLVPEERSEGLWSDAWEQLNLGPEWLDFDVNEMLDQVGADRTLEWRAVLEGMVAVARRQAAIDLGIRERLYTVAARHAREVEAAARQLSPDELRRAAKVGISKDRIKVARERRNDGGPTAG